MIIFIFVCYSFVLNIPKICSRERNASNGGSELLIRNQGLFAITQNQMCKTLALFLFADIFRLATDMILLNRTRKELID